MLRKGFTLIELLVVIAIIAILAAILFPVFAQAKAAAKNSSDISNVKQQALAVIMYAADYDDVFPFAMDNNWNVTWAGLSQPYVKSFPIYRSPFDSRQGFNASQGWLEGWTGITISYGANGYYHPTNSPVSGNCGCGNTCDFDGVMSPMAQPDACGAGVPWHDELSKSSTAITQPAGTILIADKFNTDTLKNNGWGNFTAFCGASFMNIRSADWDWCAPAEIPDGTINAANAYPTGPDGAVSLTNAGKANFAFVDGHTKTFKPAATNPDPVNRPQDNMWDSDR